MGVPISYRKDSESAIASYNFTDIAEGTGIVNFLGMKTAVSGATAYILSENTIYSDTIETTSTANTTLTFNLSAFNLPKIIKGTAIINYSNYLNTAGVGALDILFTFQKVSSNIASNIATIQAVQLTRGAGGTTIKNNTVTAALPQTHFKIGDNLRITAALTLQNPAADTWSFGHDPANRDGSSITPAATYPTKFQALIPFKLDL